MNLKVRRTILKAGFIGSVICLAGAIIQLAQTSPGSTGRTAMILVGTAALVTSLSFLLQLRQKRP